MNDRPEMKDSGERQTFSTGAVRDRGGFKPRPDLISPHANLREGAWLAVGAEKYGTRNYEKGMPISDCVASLTRHLEAYKLGMTDEDHAAAIRTNAGFIIHFEEEIKAGRLPASLDDMPKYEQQDILTPAACSDEANMRRHKRLMDRIDAPEELGGLEADAVDLAAAHARQTVERPTFYVAGPMRGIPFLNFPAFDEAAHAARRQGFNVVNPADLDREHGIDPVNDPASVDRAQEADLNLTQTIVQRDCAVITGLDKARGDGLILLPGWAKSTGARAEVGLALWLELGFLIYEPTVVEGTGGVNNIHYNQIVSQLYHQENK